MANATFDDDLIDQGLADSFPASDPPSLSTPTHAGHDDPPAPVVPPDATSARDVRRLVGAKSTGSSPPHGRPTMPTDDQIPHIT